MDSAKGVFKTRSTMHLNKDQRKVLPRLLGPNFLGLKAGIYFHYMRDDHFVSAQFHPPRSKTHQLSPKHLRTIGP